MVVLCFLALQLFIPHILPLVGLDILEHEEGVLEHGKGNHEIGEGDLRHGEGKHELGEGNLGLGLDKGTLSMGKDGGMPSWS